jgi:hypothetical protein
MGGVRNRNFGEFAGAVQPRQYRSIAPVRFHFDPIPRFEGATNVQGRLSVSKANIRSKRRRRNDFTSAMENTAVRLKGHTRSSSDRNSPIDRGELLDMILMYLIIAIMGIAISPRGVMPKKSRPFRVQGRSMRAFSDSARFPTHLLTVSGVRDTCTCRNVGCERHAIERELQSCV